MKDATTPNDLSPGIDSRAQFILDYDVSHETAMHFDRYAALLAQWQTRMNLVAPSTLPQIWTRHFADSAQLFPLLPPEAKILVDIGSGAGFPGLVLAILAKAANRPIHVHLVESIQKKALFLQAVVDDLGLPVTVHATRTEQMHGLKADIVTARALAGLPELFRLVQPFYRSATRLLLLKGARAAEELTSAGSHWQFSCVQRSSRTDPHGMILDITALKFKTGLRQGKKRLPVERA